MSTSPIQGNARIGETYKTVATKTGLKEAIWSLLAGSDRPYTVKEITQLLHMEEATANSALTSLMKEGKIKRNKVSSTVNKRKIPRYVYYGVEPYSETKQEAMSPLMEQVYDLFEFTKQKYSAERVSALLGLSSTSTAPTLYRLYKQGFLSRHKEYSGTRKRYVYAIEENADRDFFHMIEVMNRMPKKGGTLKELSSAAGISIRTLKEVMRDMFKKGQVCKRRHGDYVENESIIYFLPDEKTLPFHIHQLLEYKIVQKLKDSSAYWSLGDLEKQLGVNLSRIRKTTQSMYDSFIIDRIDLSCESYFKRGYGYYLTKIGKERTINTWDYFHEIIRNNE